MKRFALYASAAVLLFVAAGIGYSAAPVLTPLRTSGITIVDTSGCTRGTIGMEGSDPAITLFDTSNHARLRLSCTATTTTISMRDQAGNVQCGISYLPTGTSITMQDGNANRVFLRTNSGTLTLVDSKTSAVLWSSKPQ